MMCQGTGTGIACSRHRLPTHAAIFLVSSPCVYSIPQRTIQPTRLSDSRALEQPDGRPSERRSRNLDLGLNLTLGLTLALTQLQEAH